MSYHSATPVQEQSSGGGGGNSFYNDSSPPLILQAIAMRLGSHENDGKKGFCCCNPSQYESFITIGVTALITAFLWRSIVFAPIKLVAVFLHEFSHALATWLTCGKVNGIEVNEDYGGVTRTVGGTRWVTLSAGYTGSVAWGSFFILMCWDNLPARIAAVVFMVSCLATIFVLKIHNKQMCGMKCTFGLTMRFCIILLGAIPAGLWVLEDHVKISFHPLRWCILAIGTICTLHAVNDCVHDVFLKKINNSTQGKSDAVMFADELCGTARCWGFLWSLLSISVVLLALYGVVMLQGKCKIV